ncbi:MAG: aldehyde dehydrogenase family protein, partial [Rhizobiaceae bacterium]
MTIHNNFIAGEWLAGGDETKNINPSNTDEVIGVYARGTREHAETAIDAARTAFPAWARSGIQQRHDILK